MAGVPYTEQNHLHGQRREFRVRNNTQKMKENYVKTNLFSLAYLTPIKLQNRAARLIKKIPLRERITPALIELLAPDESKNDI